MLSIESLNGTLNQENADYAIMEIYNKLSKTIKKKKISLRNHPFKRLDINETQIYETINIIRSYIKSTY